MSRSTTVRLTICSFLLFAGAGPGCRRSSGTGAPAGPAPKAADPEPAGDPNCGAAGRPDCPLQAWMDSNMNAALSNEDYPAMARGFRQLADDPPSSGFSGWGYVAGTGAEAAERQDQTGVRAACDGCHEDYREQYRRTIRHRPLRASADPR
jgi:hypothetical protein